MSFDRKMKLVSILLYLWMSEYGFNHDWTAEVGPRGIGNQTCSAGFNQNALDAVAFKGVCWDLKI